MTASMFRTALAVLLALQIWTVHCAKRQSQQQSHWVDIWGSMPQLVEPANLPSAPFVSIFIFTVFSPRGCNNLYSCSFW